MKKRLTILMNTLQEMGYIMRRPEDDLITGGTSVFDAGDGMRIIETEGLFRIRISEDRFQLEIVEWQYPVYDYFDDEDSLLTYLVDKNPPP